MTPNPPPHILRNFNDFSLIPFNDLIRTPYLPLLKLRTKEQELWESHLQSILFEVSSCVQDICLFDHNSLVVN